MKHSLIVTAHPSHHGFVHAMAEYYAQGVKMAGGKSEILDLYDPRNAQPFLAFETEEKWPTHNLRFMQEKISKADEIVLCFPIWWSEAPAILKNWFDFNFTGGFAYRFTKSGVEKLMENKTAKILATADAPAFLYNSLLSPFRIIWKTLRLGFCGIKTTHFKVYGKMRKCDNACRKRMLKEIQLLAQK
jgi:NAD(P)H dehydrogenase (quinone)